MSSDGNAASSFSNDVSHQLYSRAGLNHKATIAVAASCSAFAFLLLICLGLCCCIGSRVRSSRTIQGGQHGSGSEDWNTSQVEVQSYNPSQLWTPTPAERDLEYAASQRHRGWAIGRNIPGLEEHPTAVEMGTEIPSRAPNGSTSAAVLHLPVRHPLRTEVWSQTSTPSDEGSMKPQAAFTQPPALKCCNNTFRTQADYNRHRRYHDKPVTCPHCQRSFGTTRDVDRHVNQVHQRTKVWFCLEATCKHSRASGGKGFPRKDNWRRHMRDVHGVEAN